MKLDSSKAKPAVSTFPCTRCGLCCKHLPGLWALGLPVDKKRGCCTHYSETEGCTIYADRPDCCRVRDHESQKMFCDTLQDMAGVPADSPLRVELKKKPAEAG